MSAESACQNRRAWCGACCGIHNLDVPLRQRERLLKERSRELAGVDITQPDQVFAYRKRREELEATLPRFDTSTYVCPFLGELAGGARSGCLIHPSVTGLTDSQRFSFYGAAICQSYDCRSKQEDDGRYRSLLADCFGNSSTYGLLMGDYDFLLICQKIPRLFERMQEQSVADNAQTEGRSASDHASAAGDPAGDDGTRAAYLLVARRRAELLAEHGISSFELRTRYFDSLLFELCAALHLDARHFSAEIAKVDPQPLFAAIRILIDSPASEAGPAA